MKAAKRGHSRVMHLRTSNTTCHKRSAHLRPVASCFSQQYQTWGFEPSLYLNERRLKGAGRAIDFGVGHDGQEFVKARPGDCPSRPAFSQRREARKRPFMPR